MEKETANDVSVLKPFNAKIEVIESSLNQTIYYFRDFVNEFEQMHMLTESAKKQIIAQKEKCERKCCIGSEELKKVIEVKENIIQHVASALTKLNETKNFNILSEVFIMLFGESKPFNNNAIKEEINSDNFNIDTLTLLCNKEESLKNMSIGEQDSSVSEIEGTPTGRRSPIIQNKKTKSISNITGLRDKKKCPQNWPTPEKKNMKQTNTYPTPTGSKGSGRLRQQRIAVVRRKPLVHLDLTSTLQFSKGKSSQAADNTQNNHKLEVVENDDTIMPSPTSGSMFPSVYKSLSKESPHKFKMPLSSICFKEEKTSPKECKENCPNNITDVSQLEGTILQEYLNDFQSPKKSKTYNNSPILADDSISLLHPLNNVIEAQGTGQRHHSPVKRPLAENLNIVNMPFDAESSMSILPTDIQFKVEPVNQNIKRTKSQMLEPLYKELTVRRKAEKKALPGWSCDQCKNFYGELYKDKPEMLLKKMDECSKHRGRNNPIRPKTPPGYWEPRWDVPDDTEEFNKRNNAT